MDDMSYSESWTQGSAYYEQLTIVDDMNDSGSHELRTLNSMNNSGYGWYEWFYVMSSSL